MMPESPPTNTLFISQGIPRIEAGPALADSELFREMEIFSDRFLDRNRSALRSYDAKWISDPLRQWSRRWEYPFVYQRLARLAATGAALNLLDAGSGVTFFPFYLAARLPNVDVRCVDRDVGLNSVFQKLKSDGADRVRFAPGDLHELSHDDKSIDIIYCVSVLEHTDDHRRILDEFHRVLKPGGRLLVTFDIALDGHSDISPAAAGMLLNDLNGKFASARDDAGPAASPTSMRPDLATLLDSTGELLTTEHVRRHHPERLPWRFPRLSALKSSLRRGRLSLALNLTCYCGEWIKAE
jgi:SAM-dependent methyltransferase